MTKHQDLSISKRAILVSLGISEWTARKFDKGASQGVTARAGAVEKAARVNKNLLPAAVSLERVHKATNDIRGEYYKRTLPWRDGAQIIPTSAYVEFTQWVNAARARWEGEVDEFVRDYPDLKRDAEIQLNGLFNEADYPPADQIASRFRFNVTFEPVPDAKDWRVDVGDEHLARIKADLERSIGERLGQAMQDAWRRVYEVVERAHERLSDPKAIFRNSLVENAVELCSLLPQLNVVGDPDLEAMRQRLERSLAACDPQSLREEPALRSKVADEMSAIMSKMAPFYQPGA